VVAPTGTKKVSDPNSSLQILPDRVPPEQLTKEQKPGGTLEGEEDLQQTQLIIPFLQEVVSIVTRLKELLK
jgi:hypothetical protein